MTDNRLRRTWSIPDQLRKTRAGRYRRGSHDDLGRVFSEFLLDVQTAHDTLLEQEDTDKDYQITIDDDGSKVLLVPHFSSSGYKGSEVRGTYQLSNLLQEVSRAIDKKAKLMVLSQSVLAEDPVIRLRRLIKTLFWPNLIRRLDASLLHVAAPDTKDLTGNPRPRIYVPVGVPKQLAYYKKAAEENPELNLDVQSIPPVITDEVYREIIKKPGLLALEMEEVFDEKTGQTELRGLPFVVPGGCFNELYNWDSYFIALGLLADGETELVKSLVLNFVFEVQHYGLVPNANRSYYLLRSQPPFLTDLALRTYHALSGIPGTGARAFLRRATLAAMKEYHSVWTSVPRLDKETGLSRFRPAGIASPPECTLEHFAEILRPFAEKHGLGHDLGEFRKQYDAGLIDEPELHEYFLHDRSVRESGHDISLRVEHVSADLATIDLNSLLYKYERDIAYIIRTFFDDAIDVPDDFFVTGMTKVETSAPWERRANLRKQAMNKYLWSDSLGTFMDYNTKSRKITTFETVTSAWALWCGVASPEQAARIVEHLKTFENPGGLASTNKDLRYTTVCHESHQWDYPYAWAPHQVMAWDGLRNYGYHDVADRLTYRWLHVITKVFYEFNGTVVEKYDVSQLTDSHKVDVDYGNQGLGFKGYAKEGFGWTNASYVYGLNAMTTHAKKALGVLAPWETYAAAMSADQVA